MNKLKILVLDDSEERHEMFKKLLGDVANFTFKKTAKDAYKVMIDDYQVLFLDGDLGIGQPSGSDFLDYVLSDPVTHELLSNMTVIIHSCNPPLVNKILYNLDEFNIMSYRVPFTNYKLFREILTNLPMYG
jgi:hypothetical protein